ncbi:MAG: glycogen debranching enzyme GlgX, partial [Limnobacter sp.]|nr:glycogen debranching enzyme GlgX [Limnobacter sp.]
GTPMMLAGDEFGHTQHGNNNAYAQDNEITWLAWDKIKPEGRELLEFTRKLIALRKTYPILHRGRFLAGRYNEELDVKDVTWLTPAGEEMDEGHWHDTKAKCFGMLLDGRAQPTGIKRRGDDATLLMVMNAHHDVVEFVLPEVPEGRSWVCLIDTNVPDPDESGVFPFGHRYEVTGRSMLVFVLEKERRRRQRLGVSTELDLAPPPMPTDLV